MLIVSAFGVVISIAHGDRDGDVVGDHNGVRRHASRCLLRRLVCRIIAPRCRTHHMEASPGPPEAFYGQGANEG